MSIDSRELTRHAMRISERLVSRRGLIVRGALAASVLAVSPFSFLVRPANACGSSAGTCGTPNCDCGSDGYTAFCCTLTGNNSCPNGTFVGGYWKCANYTGNGLCHNAGHRWYLDCNIDPGTNCDCRCANGDCSKRRVCCNKFRYPGCNEDIDQITCIKCRIVRCNTPWSEFPTHCHSPGPSGPCKDPTTCSHEAGCLQ
jgi:hypothetical protein